MVLGWDSSVGHLERSVDADIENALTHYLSRLGSWQQAAGGRLAVPVRDKAQRHERHTQMDG